MESLALEWQLRSSQLEELDLVSIYFGGGTPALLGAERIGEILGWIDKKFGITPSVEVTLEANPENITLALMKSYRDVGVNRVSIGIQTVDDPLLITLGRTHTGKKALESVELTADAGLSNISVDLMYDLPTQGLNHWEETLNHVLRLPLTHLSLYNLTIEPHTVFFKKREQLKKTVPDEEVSLKMYERAVMRLEEAGLKQYEISAFAKDGYPSRHNSGYWTGRSFLGLGPSAFSYWEEKRFKNISNLNGYTRMLNDNQFPVDFEEKLEPAAHWRELLAINLRLLEGIDLEKFTLLTKETLVVLDNLERKGLIIKDGTNIKLTKQGILFYDSVAVELI